MSTSQIIPIEKAWDVTPGTSYSKARGLYVGVTGNVVVTQPDATTTTYTGLAAGYWHPIYSTNIVASGTTATNIKAGI